MPEAINLAHLRQIWLLSSAFFFFLFLIGLVYSNRLGEPFRAARWAVKPHDASANSRSSSHWVWQEADSACPHTSSYCLLASMITAFTYSNGRSTDYNSQTHTLIKGQPEVVLCQEPSLFRQRSNCEFWLIYI